jgi:methionyl-tRNA formyltransferase
VWQAKVADVALRPGEIAVKDRRLFAGCGDGSIELIEVQLEGKKKMAAAAFLNGNSIEKGDHFE